MRLWRGKWRWRLPLRPAGLFSGGADEVVIEDMHGDGCNIDCALLPRDARLLRGITHDIVGLTGILTRAMTVC